MTIRRSKFAVGLILFALTTSASAATVVLDGTTATGILGLDIGGSTYNVSFQFDSFDNLNTGGNFPYLGDAVGAGVAEAAILVALNTSSAFFVGPSAATASGGFRIPYATSVHPVLGPQASVRIAGYVPANSQWQALLVGANVATDSVTHYAVLTAVPVPAAIWLFASALGLFGVRHRK